ncbi:MAG TPA: energy transducer TonB [Chitinophagaceae bacterium]|nr:energy transducer TonB [Chitinophagaceae bacterium]
MRLLPISVLFLTITVCHAQETERKVKRSKNGDKEEFYVLKSDNDVMHGSYEKKGNNSSVSGTYKNGLKDGVWTEFSKGSRLRSRGKYLNNEQVGLWKFYNWEGELEQEYDFSTRQLLSDFLLASMKERKFRVIKGSDTIVTFLERPPIYLTGKTRMQSALTKGSQIGLILMLTKASGKVIVGFTIDTAGMPRDYRIISGVHQACDAEGLRMVKQLPPNWLPALLDGKPVEVEHSITIAFKGSY